MDNTNNDILDTEIINSTTESQQYRAEDITKLLKTKENDYRVVHN
jgi:hypothetical protein